MTLRTIAVDWSGALTGASQKIWLAETTSGCEVVRLGAGRDRRSLVAHLIDESKQDPLLVVGLDFAFSLPAWFLRERQLDSAPALWELAERDGESWLARCDPPFWGRPGRARPALAEHFRCTDRDVPATGGIRPKSVFQIGGAGAVGTGSIRGMPMLKTLRAAGFAIWPFDTPRFPLVIEIYPRALTGTVAKSSPEERRHYIETRYPELEARILEAAVASDDAFDALISALVMAAHGDEFGTLTVPSDAESQLEGRIWLPRETRPAAPRVRGLRNSSRTRVGPVFRALGEREQLEPQWIKRLLGLAASVGGHQRPWHAEDLAVLERHHEPKERALQPPVALLSWLVRNLDVPVDRIASNDPVACERRKLAAKDPETIERALGLLRRGGSGKAWYILEGPTYPDVLIVTPDALVVIEGKRTEAGATTSTTWMVGRHQMLRHIDAAWEIRGRRSVYGFFIVEAAADDTRVPASWLDVARDTRSERAVEASLPHRSRAEQTAIVECFLGVTTWQAIVIAFDLPTDILADAALL